MKPVRRTRMRTADRLVHPFLHPLHIVRNCAGGRKPNPIPRRRTPRRSRLKRPKRTRPPRRTRRRKRRPSRKSRRTSRSYRAYLRFTGKTTKPESTWKSGPDSSTGSFFAPSTREAADGYFFDATALIPSFMNYGFPFVLKTRRKERAVPS